MNTKPLLVFVVSIVILGSLESTAHQSQPAPTTNAPTYTSDGQLRLPVNYREWVYLTTGFDMSYSAANGMDHHMFDNVFVNPESYQAFLKTGTWPDKTMLALEVRGAKSKGSINQAGNYQGTDRMGLEIHVKDTSRFKDQGNWAFFGFDDKPTSTMTPTSMACYSCHAQHAAVDTTFVQFYPTLLPIAVAHNTLSANYREETAPATAPKDAATYPKP
jgi:Cytochrome P460